MRVRILAALLLVADTIGGLGYTTATTSSKSVGVPTKAPAGAPAAQESPDEPGTIDGAKNPEKVSDQVAYSLLFRFLNHRKVADLAALIKKTARKHEAVPDRLQK